MSSMTLALTISRQQRIRQQMLRKNRAAAPLLPQVWPACSPSRDLMVSLRMLGS
jgi:hypothetical protein